MISRLQVALSEVDRAPNVRVQTGVLKAWSYPPCEGITDAFSALDGACRFT